MILERKKMREVKVYSPSQILDDYYLFARRMIVIVPTQHVYSHTEGEKELETNISGCSKNRKYTEVFCCIADADLWNANKVRRMRDLTIF